MGSRVVTGEDDRDALKAKACHLSDDEWQAFANKQAAEAIGRWLEQRGKLDQPIRTFSMLDLGRMADAAIARWIVVNTYRLTHHAEPQPNLDWLLGA